MASSRYERYIETVTEPLMHPPQTDLTDGAAIARLVGRAVAANVAEQVAAVEAFLAGDELSIAGTAEWDNEVLLAQMRRAMALG